MSLKTKLIRRCIAAILVVGVMLFVPAGTIHYWEGWVYLSIISVPMIAFSAYYYKHDPALVERRMRTKEKSTEQRVLMRVASVITLGALLVPGLDRRFSWSQRIIGEVPLWLIVVAMVFALAGYLMTMYVMDVNRFAGRTIQVDENQKVITTGPYRIVRHPMYASSLLMILFVPLALASYVALPLCALFIPVLVVRLLNEEKVLRRELPGYAEYCEGTKYRLIPYIW